MNIKAIPTSVLFLFLSLVLGSSAVAQGCDAWFPMEKGISFEQKSYNAKDKLQGSSQMTVTESSEAGGISQATIAVKNLDKKGKALNEGSFEVGCKEDGFWMDMSSLINIDQMAQGMEASAEGDNLGIPASAQSGDELPDADLTVSMSMNGMSIRNMKIHIYDRKVEGFETITTPAGTFECIKISQRSEMNMMFKIQSKQIAWYAKGQGMIRSEDYDKNDKLQGYTIMTSISN